MCHTMGMVVRGLLDLRRRIAILVVASLLPALVIGVGAGLREHRERIREAGQQVLRMARLTAGAHAQLLEATRYLLETAALVPEVRDGRPAACATLLMGLGQRFPAYSSLLVADGGGRVLATSL